MKEENIKKVLVVGSGALTIGQSGESLLKNNKPQI